MPPWLGEHVCHLFSKLSDINVTSTLLEIITHGWRRTNLHFGRTNVLSTAKASSKHCVCLDTVPPLCIAGDTARRVSSTRGNILAARGAGVHFGSVGVAAAYCFFAAVAPLLTFADSVASSYKHFFRFLE